MRVLIPEVHALEGQRAARRGHRQRVRGVDDRVLLVEDLEDAIGRGTGIQQEGEQEADRLHRPAQHGRHREERDELGDLELPGLVQVDADAEAQREREVRQEHEPEPDPADGTGLVELRLTERLGLPRELDEGVLATAECLQHTNAVHGLLDARGEVAGLVLALAGEGAVRLLESVPGVPQRRAHEEERRSECPVPLEQQHRADGDRQDVDDEEHETERHPAAHHRDVLHHAAEQLPRLPPVMERDGQSLQSLVEPGAQVVLDLRRGGEDEPAPRPHHERLEEAEDEHRDTAPDEAGAVTRGDRSGDDRLEHEGDRQCEQARDEGAYGAEHEARHHGLREGVEARERPDGGESLGGGSHDPWEGGTEDADAEGARSGARTHIESADETREDDVRRRTRRGAGLCRP